MGQGIGLRQGNGLDDYEDARTLAEYRLLDEKHDWEKISTDDLNSYSCSLAFFDSDGMRFHLPAYLIADLKGQLNTSLLFHLAYIGNEAGFRFGALSVAQRRVVREFLSMRLAYPDHEFERAMIEEALRIYWKPAE